MAYADLLKDPRWQKKRLEILDRDKFTCTYCGDDTNTLHVHHMRYLKGKKPWEYDNSFLVTLCCHCHENVSDNMPQALEYLCDTVKTSQWHPNDIMIIAASLAQMELCHLPNVVASAYAYAFRDSETQQLLLEKYFDHLRNKSHNG